MKRRTRLGWAAVLASLVLALSCEREGNETISRLEEETLARINLLRADSAIAPLGWNDTLGSLARAHSTDMGERGYFEHTTPEGVTFDQRISAAGLEFSMAGENIFWTSADTVGFTVEELAQAAVDGWWSSPGHRDIMMEPGFNQAGVGCFQAQDRLYFTLDVIRSP